jgi:hypothetical protein
MEKRKPGALNIILVLLIPLFVFIDVFLVAFISSRKYMVVWMEGGLCADGFVCKSEKKYFYDKKMVGVADQTNFNTLPPSGRGACPSSRDGMDMVVSFPWKYGDTEFRPCAVEFPEELMNFLQDAEKF